MLGRKKKEGKPLPVTADMKIWREEFNEMSLEQHDKVLKSLGLDDEDIEEFNENFNGKKPLLGSEESETEQPALEEGQPKEKKKK